MIPYLVRASTPYHPELASTVYMLRDDHTWYVRSDKTSHKWWIFHGSWFGAIPVSKEMRTLGQAMDLLVEGVLRGFYVTGQPVLPPPPPKPPAITRCPECGKNLVSYL